MVQDFQKVMKIGYTIDGRYPEPVTFRVSGRGGVRAVAIQPAHNSVWQHMSLISDLQIQNIAAPVEVPDLAAGAGPKARKGELDMKSPGSTIHNTSRFQRGTDFFKKLYDDCQKAANSLSKEDSKQHPILFTDLTAWGGDSAAACSA